ncbi:MAG: FAD-binding oxidoreductase [Acidobacteria bacterium]|nr:FAD-binding oxidoreductase [Acidobacteriota bacterium]
MGTLWIGRSVWLTHPSPVRGRPYRALRGHLDVDVVVVGGGMTGAAIAWRFASAGVRVAVLEAGRVGRGSTAVSTAMVMREPDRDVVDLTARYGARAVTRLWRLAGEAIRDYVRTLRRLRIPCDLERVDSVFYALDAAGAARLRREWQRRRTLGLDAAWLEAAALRRIAGLRAVAGIRSRGNLQMNPYAACVGLMSASSDAGARVFERSPVSRIVARRGAVDVETSAGSVRAERVVIATGYATPAFKPLAARFQLQHTYVIATAPVAGRTPPRQVMSWSAERPYHYARWTGDGQLLLGGGDRPRVPTARRRRMLRDEAQRLREHAERLFPALGRCRVHAAWEGLFATTPDSLPYIGPHRRYPGHLFALGYGGNGMTFGFLAARLLLEQYRGIRSPDHALFAFNRKAKRR